MPTIHLLITGKVQGVYYRVSAQERAQNLGVCGWVKNTPEGAVEATATGTIDALQAFTDWCREGPQGAAVKDVAVETAPEEACSGFRILR